jgi:hypothetical protein
VLFCFPFISLFFFIHTHHHFFCLPRLYFLKQYASIALSFSSTLTFLPVLNFIIQALGQAVVRVAGILIEMLAGGEGEEEEE